MWIIRCVAKFAAYQVTVMWIIRRGAGIAELFANLLQIPADPNRAQMQQRRARSLRSLVIWYRISCGICGHNVNLTQCD